MQQGNALVNTHKVPSFQHAFFDPSTSSLQAQPVSSGGRQAAWFVQLPNAVQGVLRHYRRGGLIAKLIRDQYLWTGAQRTRSWAEYQVMQYLCQQLDCVPAPLAATYQRQGLWYRAAIIVERIPASQPLADCLSDADPVAVAKAVLAMHNAGVWHADLNAYNVLLDQRKRVWLIDFDRSRILTMSEKQRQNNLLRLRRSLVKVHGDKGLAWWSDFNRAYLQHHKPMKPNCD